MNKSSISHGVPKEHVWPLIWLQVTHPLWHTSYPWYMQGKDVPQSCLLDSDLKHEERHSSHWSSSVCLSPFHQSPGLPLEEGRWSRKGEKEGYLQRLSIFAWFAEVAVSPHGVSDAQWAWDGCCVPVLAPSLVEKLPKFRSQGSSAFQQGTLPVACPAGLGTGVVPGQQLPQPFLRCWLSVLAPSVQLTALPAGGECVTPHGNLLDKLLLVLLGSLSCTGR